MSGMGQSSQVGRQKFPSGLDIKFPSGLDIKLPSGLDIKLPSGLVGFCEPLALMGPCGHSHGQKVADWAGLLGGK